MWDNAATTCYQALSSEGSLNASALSVYDSAVVGLCTKSVDAGVLSSAGVVAVSCGFDCFTGGGVGLGSNMFVV